MESQRQAGPLPAGASRVYLSASDILANALLSLFQCTARKPQCLPPPPHSLWHFLTKLKTWHQG